MNTTIYNLLLSKRKFYEYDKRSTPALNYFQEAEKKLLKTFSDEQMDLYKDFKAEFLNQMEYVIIEEGQYFLSYGLKIGQELGKTGVYIDADTLDED